MLRASDMITAMLRATNEKSFGAMQRVAATMPHVSPFLEPLWYIPSGSTLATTRTTAPRISRDVTGHLGYSHPAYVETDWRIKLEMRFAAIALAVQMYRADHG